MAERCKFWLPKKNRFCANIPLNYSLFCGNHNQRSDNEWIPCPIDPSHSVLKENLEGHLKRCPLLKQVQYLTLQPFYQKGINAGKEEDEEQLNAVTTTVVEHNVTSEMKRKAVYSLNVTEFYNLIKKIEAVHGLVCNDIRDSFKIPEACSIWIKREIDRKLPFQEKHVVQQASILGNLEAFGVLKNSVGKNQDDGDIPAVVEFGAGRGYLTQMLADCYGTKRVFLVERKSYKLKADRSLRQKESLTIERLRIDIEDLNLSAVESLRGAYVAIGKHLCGSATDLTLRCCLTEKFEQCSGAHYIRGLSIATCCHHLCQWKHYINKRYLLNLGITKEDFHAITWFTSWAVDADHGSDHSDVTNGRLQLESIGKEERGGFAGGVEDIARNMKAIERARLGFMCKQIIDMGRLMWIRECGLEAELVKYVPPSISPENHLLIARDTSRWVRTEIDVPVSVAYNCYSDREAIPRWMPFISSVKVLEDKPDLSQWSLKYKAFGRDIEYSWLARNMQPIRNQKIHWRSLEGLPNRGAVRFFPKGPSSCIVELTVSYEIPQLLIPVASALQPFLETLLRRGLERFATFAKSYSAT